MTPLQLCDPNYDLINTPVFVLLQKEDGQRLFSELCNKYKNIATGLRFIPRIPEDKQSATLSLILTALSTTISQIARNNIDPQTVFKNIYPNPNQSLKAALKFFYNEDSRNRFNLIANSIFGMYAPQTPTTFSQFFQSINVSTSNCNPSSISKYDTLKIDRIFKTFAQGSVMYLVLPVFDADNLQESMNAYLIEVPNTTELSDKPSKSKSYIAVPIIVSAVCATLIYLHHKKYSKQ